MKDRGSEGSPQGTTQVPQEDTLVGRCSCHAVLSLGRKPRSSVSGAKSCRNPPVPERQPLRGEAPDGLSARGSVSPPHSAGEGRAAV